MSEGIELSVVLPCLNEEDNIGICIEKIKDVLAQKNIRGEIIVVDNGSSDRSGEIADSRGARVIFAPQRGYGAAYLAGLKEAKGKYILIADSDNSYDFYNIPEFLSFLREGYEFVIGSRFKGKIERGAMSWSHRYLGNPMLSGMFRLFFHSRLSDIHCGMRAFTSEGYHRMKLKSLGMEFATEMVVSALQGDLRIAEIPIDYHPRKGKSKLKPFSDAWRHVRFMLLYCPVWLYFVPGLIGFLSGLLVLFALLKGPVFLLGRYWDIHVMVFAAVICILSYQLLHLGLYAHTFAIGRGFLKYDKFTVLFQRYFTLERGLVLGLILFILGSAINLSIFLEWFMRHFGALHRIRESILAMTLLVIGLQTIFSSFFMSLLLISSKDDNC